MIFIRCDNERLRPRYMTLLAAGADICSAEPMILDPYRVTMIPTGVFIDVEKTDLAIGSMAVPMIPCLDIRLRSSLVKRNIMLANGVGTIDADYSKEIKVALFNWGRDPQYIVQGERIAQLVCFLTRTLDGDVYLEENVRAGGFGSTDKICAAPLKEPTNGGMP